MKKHLLAGIALGFGLALSGAAQAQIKLGIGGPITGPNASFGAQLNRLPESWEIASWVPYWSVASKDYDDDYDLGIERLASLRGRDTPDDAPSRGQQQRSKQEGRAGEMPVLVADRSGEGQAEQGRSDHPRNAA